MLGITRVFLELVILRHCHAPCVAANLSRLAKVSLFKREHRRHADALPRTFSRARRRGGSQAAAQLIALALTPRSAKQRRVTIVGLALSSGWGNMKVIAVVGRAGVYEAIALAVFAGMVVLFVHAIVPLIAD